MSTFFVMHTVGETPGKPAVSCTHRGPYQPCCLILTYCQGALQDTCKPAAKQIVKGHIYLA